MRRVLVCFLFLLSVQSFAVVRLGLQGGISSANVSVNPSITSNARGGFGIGAALEFGVGGNWNLQVEGLYVQKGYIIPATALVGEQTIRLDYIEIPVLLKYTFNLLLLKPFFAVGPYLGIKSKADYVFNNVVLPLSNYSSSDLGLTFGGGVEIGLSSVTSIFASVRYDLGFSNLDDSASGTTVRSKGVLILGGFLFGV